MSITQDCIMFRWYLPDSDTSKRCQWVLFSTIQGKALFSMGSVFEFSRHYFDHLKDHTVVGRSSPCTWANQHVIESQKAIKVPGSTHVLSDCGTQRREDNAYMLHTHSLWYSHCQRR